jgi:hypothetical protein
MLKNIFYIIENSKTLPLAFSANEAVFYGFSGKNFPIAAASLFIYYF